MGKIVGAYCDGGCINCNPSPVGGTWAYCFVDAEGDIVAYKSGVISPQGFSGKTVSNNNSELYALCMAILDMPTESYPTFYSDSQVSIGRIFSNWKLNNVPQWLKIKAGDAKQKLCRLDFDYCLLDGHPTKAQLESGIGKRGNPCSKFNVFCDDQCNKEAKAYLELQRQEALSGW
jgi:ribonuclease HI